MWLLLGFKPAELNEGKRKGHALIHVQRFAGRFSSAKCKLNVEL
jgi:hypothetical protein